MTQAVCFPPDPFLSSSFMFFYTSETTFKNSLQAILEVKCYAEGTS